MYMDGDLDNKNFRMLKKKKKTTEKNEQFLREVAGYFFGRSNFVFFFKI